jgi:hypothetical protein
MRLWHGFRSAAGAVVPDGGWILHFRCEACGWSRNENAHDRRSAALRAQMDLMAKDHYTRCGPAVLAWLLAEHLNA